MENPAVVVVKRKPDKLKRAKKFEGQIEKLAEFKNPCSLLSEMKLNPTYALVRLHQKFRAKLTVNCGTFYGYGTSIKTAKTNAAKTLLNSLIKKCVETQSLDDCINDTDDSQCKQMLFYLINYYVENVKKNDRLGSTRPTPQHLEESQQHPEMPEQLTLRQQLDALQHQVEMLRQVAVPQQPQQQGAMCPENADNKSVIQMVHQKFPGTILN